MMPGIAFLGTGSSALMASTEPGSTAVARDRRLYRGPVLTDHGALATLTQGHNTRSPCDAGAGMGGQNNGASMMLCPLT
jgi:hypothetical protein